MRSQIRELLQTVLLALLIFVALQASIQNYRVQGSSMQPTLHEGQFLLVNRLVYSRLDKARLARFLPFVDAETEDVVYPFHPPQRGDVVVFLFPLDPSERFVKRIIAVPGDTVEIRRGKVYVNDELLEESYIVDSSRASLERRRMTAEEYFVLGDNRLASNDSRRFGPVPLNNILGKAWITYWPFPQLGFLQVARGGFLDP